MKEFEECWKAALLYEDKDQANLARATAKWWLQKMSEQKERLIKEVTELPEKCELRESDEFDEGLKEMKLAILDILRRLQSV